MRIRCGINVAGAEFHTKNTDNSSMWPSWMQTHPNWPINLEEEELGLRPSYGIVKLGELLEVISLLCFCFFQK